MILRSPVKPALVRASKEELAVVDAACTEGRRARSLIDLRKAPVFVELEDDLRGRRIRSSRTEVDVVAEGHGRTEGSCVLRRVDCFKFTRLPIVAEDACALAHVSAGDLSFPERYLTEPVLARGTIFVVTEAAVGPLFWLVSLICFLGKRFPDILERSLSFVQSEDSLSLVIHIF